jgi:hypothetical protein
MLLRRRIFKITPTIDGGITVDVEETHRRQLQLANVTRAEDGTFLLHPDADGDLTIDVEEDDGA